MHQCRSDHHSARDPAAAIRLAGPTLFPLRAFTLVELLVVIAVLSILIALLIPAVSGARDRAIEKKCAVNLRGWGQAFYLYASDHRGFLPHTDDRTRSPSPFGAKDAHDHCYVDVLPPLMGERAWRDYPAGQKPAGGFWQCPAARPGPDSEYSYKPSIDGYHSYAMNSYLEHDFLFGLPWSVEPQPSYLDLAKCEQPSSTILMFEQTLDPRQGYGQKGSFKEAGRHTAEDARAVTERHSRRKGGLGGNVLCLDGHVDWRNDLWDETLKNPRIPARGDLTWFPYEY